MAIGSDRLNANEVVSRRTLAERHQGRADEGYAGGAFPVRLSHGEVDHCHLACGCDIADADANNAAKLLNRPPTGSRAGLTVPGGHD
jgi:hypothetical protein